MKSFYWHEWPCCSGTYIQNMAEYHNMIYLRDERGLFVNLYVPSEVTWDAGRANGHAAAGDAAIRNPMSARSR